MSFGSIIVAEDTHMTNNGDSGGIGRNKYDGLLLVRARVVWVVLTHDEVDCTAWVTGTGGEPLVAVDHDLVALLNQRCLDIRCVRRCDC